MANCDSSKEFAGFHDQRFRASFKNELTYHAPHTHSWRLRREIANCIEVFYDASEVHQGLSTVHRPRSILGCLIAAPATRSFTAYQVFGFEKVITNPLEVAPELMQILESPTQLRLRIFISNRTELDRVADSIEIESHANSSCSSSLSENHFRVEDNFQALATTKHVDPGPRDTNSPPGAPEVPLEEEIRGRVSIGGIENSSRETKPFGSNAFHGSVKGVIYSKCKAIVFANLSFELGAKIPASAVTELTVDLPNPLRVADLSEPNGGKRNAVASTSLWARIQASVYLVGGPTLSYKCSSKAGDYSCS